VTAPYPPEHFVDGAGTALLVGGVVRLDLVALTRNPRSLRDEQELHTRLRLVLSPTAFLQMYHTIGAFLAREGIEVGHVPAAAAGRPPAAQAKGSPNFDDN
jgi:hypothetical protein